MSEEIDNLNFTGPFVIDFKGMPSNLERLNLNNNLVNSIKFKQMDKLKSLRVRNIKLKSYGDLKFNMMPNLEELDLSENKIDFNTTNIISSIVNLYILNVGLNSIYQINLTRWLNVLDLSFNYIKHIYSFHFAKPVFLIKLYLNDNQIQFVEKNCFDFLVYLEVINLENNLLKMLNFKDLLIYMNIELISRVKQILPWHFIRVFKELKKSFHELS